jgi:WD40 repeat protein
MAVAFSPNGKLIVSGTTDGTLRLWDLASGQEIWTFVGHVLDVTSIAFSPNGKFVLSGSADTTLRLWDVASGQEVRRFEGHKWAVSSVAFSPDGTLALSSGSMDRTVRLWDVASGEEVDQIDLTSSNDYPYAVAFSPDGRSFVVGTTGGVIIHFELLGDKAN